MGHDWPSQLFAKVKLGHVLIFEPYERPTNWYHQGSFKVELGIFDFNSLPQRFISFTHHRKKTVSKLPSNAEILRIEGFFFTNETVLTATNACVVRIPAEELQL